MADWTRTTIHRGDAIERVLCVTGDVDGDGDDEVLIGGRTGTMGLHLLDHASDGQWRHHLIDSDYDRMDAGGWLVDLDGDGRLDFLAGPDRANNLLTWWRNAGEPATPWTRRVICEMPGRQSHDQIAADLDGDGRLEVYFWNQGAETLFVARVPDDPAVEPWPDVQPVAEGVREEGLAIADVDGDGRAELIAGQSWYRCTGAGRYERQVYAEGFVSPRIAAADLRGHGQLEIVIAEGDASIYAKRLGRLARLTPGDDVSKPWAMQVLHEELEDPHSIIVADFDGDGRPDVFIGELGDPNGAHHHPPAQRIYWNCGGELVEQIIDAGVGTHEAKLLRVGGRTMIVGKPYRNVRDAIERDDEVDAVHVWAAEA